MPVVPPAAPPAARSRGARTASRPLALAALVLVPAVTVGFRPLVPLAPETRAAIACLPEVGLGERVDPASAAAASLAGAPAAATAPDASTERAAGSRVAADAAALGVPPDVCRRSVDAGAAARR